MLTQMGGCDLGASHSQPLDQPSVVQVQGGPLGVQGAFEPRVPQLVWAQRLLAPAHPHLDFTVPPPRSPVSSFPGPVQPENSPASRGLVRSCGDVSALGHDSRGREGRGPAGSVSWT